MVHHMVQNHVQIQVLWTPLPHQDCHSRAWDAVAAYMEKHIKVFSSRSLEAEGTLMPASRAWLRETISEAGYVLPSKLQTPIP